MLRLDFGIYGIVFALFVLGAQAQTRGGPANAPSVAVARPTTDAEAGHAQTTPMASPLVGPPAPPPPVQQRLRPEQMPPVVPKITYQDGLLAVETPNSTLGDILNGIRGKTGIQFEGMGSAPDRVALSQGPAPADVVLTNLLRGSRFDFIIVNQTDNPDSVQRVILTPHAGSAPPPAGALDQNRAHPAADGNDDDDNSDEPDAEAATPENQLPGPKTTEQLLQELKQMQQQQQQQNQGRQGAPAPQKPPLKPSIPQF